MNISKKLMTGPMMAAADMLFEGKPEEEIAHQCFNCLTDDLVSFDKEKTKKAIKQLHKWMQEPRFIEYYRKLVNYKAMTLYGPAIDRIGAQINDPNAWLANKAANDILTRFTGNIMGEEDHTVTVKIEGMPEIGEPDGAT